MHKRRKWGTFTVGKTHLGISVFAASPLRKGEVIADFTGKLLHKSKNPEEYEGREDRYIQIDKNHFLGPSKKIDDWINHSCDPNSGLRFTKSKVQLVAIKPIRANEEITWDYSTTMLDNAWQMKCDCRKKVCRQIIGDFSFLPKRLQLKYLALNIIPPYIKEYMMTLKTALYIGKKRVLKSSL